MEALAEGILRCQRPQLAHELALPSELEVGVDSLFQCGQPFFVQSFCLYGREGLGRDIRERWPPPEREGIGEQAGALGRSCFCSGGGEVLEALEVELARFDSDRIAGGMALDAIAEHLAQPVDLVLQGGLWQLRRPRGPQPVDETLGRNDLVGVQEQQREKRPLTRAAQRQRPPFLEHLDRAEYPELCADYIEDNTVLTAREMAAESVSLAV